MFNDGPVFLSLAQAIGEGRWAEVSGHPYHPLYPLCIEWLSRSGVTLETSAVVVSIFGGLLGIVALHSLLRHAFDDLNHDTIVAVTSAENVASQRVLTKLGMEYRGLREVYGVTGCWYYVLSQRGWRRLRNDSDI